MEKTVMTAASAFLEGGGEMGALTRAFDWSETPIGSPEYWPQSLRTTVSNLLRSKFPMFLWWGPDMIQFYNDAYRPSLGNEGKHPHALGQKGRECWPEIWEIIYPLIQEVRRTGEATWREDQLVPIYRNGKIEDVYWTYSYSSVLDDSGRHAGILVTCTETTQKVLNAKMLEKNINNLHNIILHAPVAMCILSGPNFILEIANERMFELWGKPSEQMLHRPLFEGLSEASGQGYEELLKNVYTTGETFTANGLPVTLPRDGILQTVYVNFVYEAYRETDGSIAGVMVVANEVTEQVLASKKIEASEARFRLLADSMPQFVWASDRNGKLNYFNEAVFRYSGRNEDELINGGWIGIVHPDEREENLRLWQHSVRTGEPFHFNHRFRNRNGEYRWQLSRAIAQRDEQGNIQMWIGTSTDIHDHKLFEEELQNRVREQMKELMEANERLVLSNKNLEEFAYVASHDMKEPIRKIHFFSDLIRSRLAGSFGQEEQRYFMRIEEATRRMESLIDDLLSYSQVSIRPPVFEKVEIDSMIRNVLNMLELEIDEKKAEIHMEGSCTVMGQPSQLQQAFQNLISNSLKFHRNGAPPRIDIQYSSVLGKDIPHASGEDFQTEYCQVELSDNGIGFEPEEAERIFNVFTRLHGNTEYKGSGIGLSIVRKVVDNHHGYIVAEGKPESGAIFRVFLPAAPVS